MGYTRNTGQLSYLITYDGSGNITVPASFTQTTVTSSMLKADSAGKLVAAVAGTDFVAPAGLSAYVPTTRTITINGTSYDLSADRSWSIVSGVSSFNTRTGAITLTDTDVTTALGYTPVTNARTLTINGTTYDLSANRSWTIVAGLSSFNTRTGDITLLDTDVTGALGYTPVTNARTITINGTTYDLSANRTWVVDTSSVTTRVIQKFTATASQTTFTITGGYTVGMVDVFLNGVKLDNATEFTASNGSTVVLTAAAAVNDVVEVYKYGGQFIANNTLRQTTAFTATAGQTTFTVNYSVGFVDVFYNGAKLAAAEFTATNGTSIVLSTACVVNDIVEVVAYNYTVGAFTGVGGSGTANTIAKWTASGTINNSIITESTNTISINTSGPGLLTLGASNSYGAISSGGGGVNFYMNGATRGGTTTAASNTAVLALDGEFYITNSAVNSNKLILTSSGNVAIGTSNSSVRLNVQASSNFETATLGTATGTMGYLSANGLYGMYVGIGNSGNTWLQSQRNDGNTATYSLLLNPQGGNVGITTTSPRTSLDVGGAIMTLYQASTVANKAAGFFCQSTSSGLTSGFGFLIQDGFSFQGDNLGSNRKLSVRKPTSDGSLGDLVAHIDSAAGNSFFAGRMERTGQPSFQANRTAGANQSIPGGDSVGTVIVFDGTQHNTGGHYNTSNGRFTAPVTGRYQFSSTCRFDGSTASTYIRLFFTINGTTGSTTYAFGHVIAGPGGYSTNYHTLTVAATLSLNSGDYVETRAIIATGSTGIQYESQFSGFLI